MDFMRKLVRGNTTLQVSQPPSSLDLMKLRRMFREIYFSANPLALAEQEEKLYAILPLFFKIFGSSPSQDMREKFGDILQFSTQVSRLMVSEIRRRASNKSTEEASDDIVHFLLPQANELSQGWLLLNVLSHLAGGGQNIADCMTSMHLPSTLVKCLYLFFDLPCHDADSGTSSKEASQKRISAQIKADNNLQVLQHKASLKDRKQFLQKIFVQTLVRMCGYISPAEELCQKDDLALLFSAVTSWCFPQNVHWRNAAAEVLITISKHGLSHNVVQYVRGKQCIKTCINNLWRASVSPGESDTGPEMLDVELCDQLLCILRFINNTSDVTQLLLDDFHQCQGYVFVAEFLLRLDEPAESSEAHRSGLYNVISSIEKLSTCGFNELTVENTIQSTTQVNFKVPTPLGRGESVRNIHAFKVLESVFVRSTKTLLCCAVLDAIFAIYCLDPANYFILYNQNTLSALSEVLPLRSDEVFNRFFNIFEYISLTLGFVPSKELTSIGLLLKDNSKRDCCLACLVSLKKVLMSNTATYRDVYREVGLLEVLITCLHRYSTQLKDSEVLTPSSDGDNNPAEKDIDHKLGIMAMDILVEMLSGSPTNTSIFRETGGARCAFNTIFYPPCRMSALSLVQALILQPVAANNDDDMGTLLGLLTTLSPNDIQLKIDILKCLCKVISRSVEASVMFRAAGGFINLISVIVGLEGCLEKIEFDPLKNQQVYDLIEVIFNTLAVALRLPANKQYFEDEVNYGSFLSALRGLGHFGGDGVKTIEVRPVERSKSPQFLNVALSELEFPLPDKEKQSYSKVLCVFHFLYLLATDSFKDEILNKIAKLQHSLSSSSYVSRESHPTVHHDTNVNHVIHPQVIIIMLQLVSDISSNDLTEKEKNELSFYLLEEIHSIITSERNEQIMCESGLLDQLLSSFEDFLADENEALNPICQRIMERLARQSVSPNELRKFLRLGKPLHCESLLRSNDIVTLGRVKSLVSISTPQNVGLQPEAFTHPPAFIEFDMSTQGSCCLYLPSLFPQSPQSPTVVGNGSLPLISGVGSEERVFPPAHCLTLSAWVYVEQFCPMRLHPIRILTITRQSSLPGQQFTCFAVHLSAKHRKLVISTAEQSFSSMAPGDLEESKEVAGFNVEHLWQEHEWHHVHVALQRSTVLKHSTVTAFLDGELLGISKLRYVSAYPSPPSSSTQQSSGPATSVHGWVGTPPGSAARSALVWRMSSLLLADETSPFFMQSALIQTSLGPEYLGSFQSVRLPDGSNGSLFAEDNIALVIHPGSKKSVDWEFVQGKCRKQDQRHILSQLGLRSVDHSEPLTLFHNLSAGVPGPARSIGAIAVGSRYRDSPRSFAPQLIGKTLQDVGGISVAVDLISMAESVEGLYAAVKFLVCIVKVNRQAADDMEKTNGYQALGMHLKNKSDLLNTHILHLAFSLAGTVDSGRDVASIATPSAFEDLLCDLEIWHRAPGELHKSLFDHFYELLSESSNNAANHKVISGLSMVKRCTHFLYSDCALPYKTVCSIVKVLQALIANKPNSADVLSVGQFAVSLMPASNLQEQDVVLSTPEDDFAEDSNPSSVDNDTRVSKRNIHLRNLLLQAVHDVVTQDKAASKFIMCLESTLGLDWLLIFMQPNVHHSSVVLALRTLFAVFVASFAPGAPPGQSGASPGVQAHSHLTIVERFQAGEGFGGWLSGADRLQERKEDSLLGFNVRLSNDAHMAYPSLCKEAVSVPGFLSLQFLLASHSHSSQVTWLLMRFALANYVTVPLPDQLDKESTKTLIQNGAKIADENLKSLSVELLRILCAQLRHSLHQSLKDTENPPNWVTSHPSAILAFFEALYTSDHYTQLMTHNEVVTSLSIALVTPNDAVTYNAKRDSTLDHLSVEGLMPSSFLSSSRPCAHPSKDTLLNLLGRMVWDSVANPKCKSTQAILDTVLDLSGEKCSLAQHKDYMSDVVRHLMKCRTAVLPSYVKNYHVTANVTGLAARFVDKIWQNLLANDTREVFAFLLHLITLCSVKPSTHALDSLHKSLSRLILHQMCQRHGSVSDQTALLDTLHALTNNRSIVFGPKCRDTSFLACLGYCLFMVSDDSYKEFGLEADQRQTTWHVANVAEKPEIRTEDLILGAAVTPREKGLVLLKKASSRVWSELLCTKQDLLTDYFKLDFHDLGSEQANLDWARVHAKDVAAKAWSNFLATERKNATTTDRDSPQQQLMKRMSSAVMRSGKKPRRDVLSKQARNIVVQDNNLWTLSHISVVRNLVRVHYNDNKEDQKHLTEFAGKEWTNSASELRRERGIWGPENAELLTKWTLDSTEGPCRMRKRMMKDETFYERYPHRQRSQNDSLRLKHKKPTSQDSWEYYRRKNCLSPYFNPDLESSEKEEVEPIPPKALSVEVEEKPASIDTEENSTEDAILLNICSKCQSAESKDASPSTFAENLNADLVQVCDMCGLIIDDLPTLDCESKPENGDRSSEEVSAEQLVEVAKDRQDSIENPADQSEAVGEQAKPDSSENHMPASASTNSFADPNSQQQDKPNNQTILKLLEKGEKIRNMFRSARIQGLDVHEGLLLFGRDHYYIIDGFTMLKSREIKDISLLSGDHDPIIPSTSHSGQENDHCHESLANRMCTKFPYDDIKEVHKRRYLLQNIALEVFNRDGRNYLLVFPQGTRAKVYSKFLSYATDLSDRGKDSISGQRSDLNVEQQGPTLLSNIIGEKTVTSRWERGEISNFQYLMHLNTLAGRSYNDLMQYPVFPWIIADYTSEVLDLTDPSTFRDLSKPMGAQSSSRLEQYKKRYRDWEELGAIETPPYHYGTHYSSAMIVASYLVRMEPFTQHFLRLQGGHFDLADRMFHSIKDSWFSASQKNMADIKELIPEFFYLPEFLLNTNKFDLGQKQNGVKLDDVILPEWAKGSPQEFIRAHREALECEYVSSHLHEWIDLIFGCKQQGEAALESNNVFHHLFYEGEVDIYSIKDPLKRNATIGFINNFGQIPKQLFKRPHPQKKAKVVKLLPDISPASCDRVFYRNLDNLKQSVNPIKELPGPVGVIVPTERDVLAVTQGSLLVPPQHTRALSWSHHDRSVRVGYYESEKPIQIFENLGCGEILCCCMPTETTLITGDRSTVVHVWRLPGLKDRNKTMTLVKSLYGHTGPVTSVCACALYGIVVTGSEDGSCILWDLNHLAFIRQLEHEKTTNGVSHICINSKTGDIVTCAGADLCLWSVNGELIAQASALSFNSRHQMITALAVCSLNEWDPDSVVATGHADGYVRFWSLDHLKVTDTVTSLIDVTSNPGKPKDVISLRGLNPDTVSLTSIGEITELPWNDVPPVEVAASSDPPDQAAPEKPGLDGGADAKSFVWKTQLVLKGKLEVSPFPNQAGHSVLPKVTSITVSKDHQKFYVGDEQGRVYSWTSS